MPAVNYCIFATISFQWFSWFDQQRVEVTAERNIASQEALFQKAQILVKPSQHHDIVLAIEQIFVCEWFVLEVLEHFPYIFADAHANLPDMVHIIAHSLQIIVFFIFSINVITHLLAALLQSIQSALPLYQKILNFVIKGGLMIIVLQLYCDFLLKLPVFELVKIFEHNRLITIINILLLPHLQQLSLLSRWQFT